jgi:hypothetical protein
LKGLKKPWLLSLAAFSFAASLYVYQSEKVFTPLFVLILICIFWKEIFALPKRHIFAAVIIGTLIAFPMLLVTVTDKQALMRARGVSVFSESTQLLERNTLRLSESKNSNDFIGYAINNRRIVFAKQIIANYLSHYDLNWLFIRGDIARHHAPNMGLLYFIELPFLFIGIYQLLFGGWSLKTKLFIFAWFFIAPIPASVTSGVPHAVRTLNFLPTYQIFIALGMITVWNFSMKYYVLSIKYKILFIILYTLCFMLYIFNVSYYFDQYFIQQNYENSKEWQYGYKEVIQSIKKNESKYSKIIVSNQPYLDQSYIFFLFYLQYPPQLYQQQTENISGGFNEKHAFGKYEFRPIHWADEQKNGKILYIGRPEDVGTNASIIDSVKFLDGSTAIEIVD